MVPLYWPHMKIPRQRLNIRQTLNPGYTTCLFFLLFRYFCLFTCFDKHKLLHPRFVSDCTAPLFTHSKDPTIYTLGWIAPSLLVWLQCVSSLLRKLTALVIFTEIAKPGEADDAVHYALYLINTKFKPSERSFMRPQWCMCKPYTHLPNSQSRHRNSTRIPQEFRKNSTRMPRECRKVPQERRRFWKTCSTCTSKAKRIAVSGTVCIVRNNNAYIYRFCTWIFFSREFHTSPERQNE